MGTDFEEYQEGIHIQSVNLPAPTPSPSPAGSDSPVPLQTGIIQVQEKEDKR